MPSLPPLRYRLRPFDSSVTPPHYMPIPALYVLRSFDLLIATFLRWTLRLPHVVSRCRGAVAIVYILPTHSLRYHCYVWRSYVAVVVTVPRVVRYVVTFTLRFVDYYHPTFDFPDVCVALRLPPFVPRSIYVGCRYIRYVIWWYVVLLVTFR